MSEDRHYNLTFPINFWGLMIRSIQIYRHTFLNYLTLAVITYLPFLIFDQFSRFDLLDIVEFFHGNFLDVIVFLTLPTLLIALVNRFPYLRSGRYCFHYQRIV